MRYKQRKDNEEFAIINGGIHRIACCDCGLVHDIKFRIISKKYIGLTPQRNNRATAQRRLHLKSKLDIKGV